jgi:hypothetical protein
MAQGSRGRLGEIAMGSHPSFVKGQTFSWSNPPRSPLVRGDEARPESYGEGGRRKAPDKVAGLRHPAGVRLSAVRARCSLRRDTHETVRTFSILPLRQNLWVVSHGFPAIFLPWNGLGGRRPTRFSGSQSCSRCRASPWPGCGGGNSVWPAGAPRSGGLTPGSQPNSRHISPTDSVGEPQFSPA